MKCLTVDIGNTRTKVGVFIDGILSSVSILACADDVRSYVQTCEADGVIISRVGSADAEIWRTIPGCRIMELSSSTPLPIGVRYDTPETLGMDRVATAVGAWAAYKGAVCLIADAGTAITYDVLSPEGSFAGGNIAPGISLRYKALSEHTATLPLLTPTDELQCSFGKSTTGAMACGVQGGVLAELMYWYAEVQKKYNDAHARLVITGGEGHYLYELCPQSLNADFRPNLIHEGLYRIFVHNHKE